MKVLDEGSDFITQVFSNQEKENKMEITNEEIKAATKRAADNKAKAAQAEKERELDRMADQFVVKARRNHSIAKLRNHEAADNRLHVVNEIAGAKRQIERFTTALSNLEARL